MFSFQQVLICGLAAWVYAYFVTNMSLIEGVKESLLSKYNRFAFSRKARWVKKRDDLLLELQVAKCTLDKVDSMTPPDLALADKYEALVQDIDQQIHDIKPRRSFHQNVSLKADILFACIYCFTFWTTIVIYNSFDWVANIGAVWAIAIIVGTFHNRYLVDSEEESEDKKVD